MKKNNKIAYTADAAAFIVIVLMFLSLILKTWFSAFPFIKTISTLMVLLLFFVFIYYVTKYSEKDNSINKTKDE